MWMLIKCHKLSLRIYWYIGDLHAAAVAKEIIPLVAPYMSSNLKPFFRLIVQFFAAMNVRFLY